MNDQNGTRYITDAAGNRTGVVLDLENYRELLEARDELDAIRAYDEAKASGEQGVPLEEALRHIEQERHRK